MSIETVPSPSIADLSLVIWTLIFLALFGILYMLARSRSSGNTLAHLNALVGPQLITLFWLHGALFDPPNNLAVMDKLGFFGFWLTLDRPFDISNYPGVFLLLVLLTFVPLIFGAIIT